MPKHTCFIDTDKKKYIYLFLVGLRHQGALDSRTRMTPNTRFCHRTTVTARKPASFWQEKRDIVVILVRDFARMSSSQNKSTTR